MYRIVIYRFFVTVGRIFFSIIEKFLFCQNQDIQDLRMYRIVIYELINPYFQIVKYISILLI